MMGLGIVLRGPHGQRCLRFTRRQGWRYPGRSEHAPNFGRQRRGRWKAAPQLAVLRAEVPRDASSALRASQRTSNAEASHGLKHEHGLKNVVSTIGIATFNARFGVGVWI
jgi:hypothetical protein